MNFAVLLAAGSGTRMKSAKIPKQFLELGGMSLLQLNVNKFLVNPLIDQIIVVAPTIWHSHAKDILSDEKYNNVLICDGGSTRQESLYKALKFIKDNCKTSGNDKIISHDVARPFVTMRIIDDNVNMLDKYDVVDTVIPATDTIVESQDGEIISKIPNRTTMYQGQTPQSFYLDKYISLYETLTPEYLEKVTDAARIFSDHGVNVGLVKGEEFNIKVTTDYDWHIAQYLVGEHGDKTSN